MINKRWKKGYKVVTATTFYKGSWCSIIASGCNKMIYRIDHISEREKFCGPLAVFKNFESADWFVTMVVGGAIFECKYKESDDKKLWYKKAKRFAKINLPDGTVFADQVMLIKRVNRRKMRKELKK